MECCCADLEFAVHADEETMFLIGSVTKSATLGRWAGRIGAAARALQFRGRADVEIRLLPGDDHELRRTADAPQQIAAWLARTLAASGGR